MKRMMIFMLAVVVFLCVFTVHEAENAERRYAEDQCRQLMHEYEEAVAMGDKIAANRAAAMYNDYIFSYSSAWEGNAPEKLKDCK